MLDILALIGIGGDEGLEDMAVDVRRTKIGSRRQCGAFLAQFVGLDLKGVDDPVMDVVKAKIPNHGLFGFTAIDLGETATEALIDAVLLPIGVEMHGSVSQSLGGFMLARR